MYNTEYNSSIYKFDIQDVKLTVTIDNTFNHSDKIITDKPLLTQLNLHFHTFSEMFFIESCPITICDEKTVQEYNDCIVNVSPFYRHFSVRNENTYRFLFSFTKNNKRITKGTYKFFENLTAIPLSRLKINKNIYFYLANLDSAYSNPTELNESAIIPLLKLIFLEIISINGNITKIDRSLSGEDYLITIDDIINNNFREDINLTFVANALFLSTKQVSRIINKNYKTSLSALLIDKKLTAAAAFLTETDMTVAEIISDLNFNTASYFFILFKKKYGCTPLVYRKKFK